MGQIELVVFTVWATLASLVSSQEPPGGYYQTKYDSLDIEDVLNHKRLVTHYAACLLSRGPCPPQGADLKRILPEALDTNCLRCTEKQKTIILQTIRRLRTEYPSIWKELLDFWDPSEQRVKLIEHSIDNNAFTSDDELNFIGNRFGESDSGNDLAGPVKPAQKPPSSTNRPSSTIRPHSTYGPPTYLPPSTTRKTITTTSRPATTTRAPSVSTTQKVEGSYDSASGSGLPTFLTRWRLTTFPADGTPTKPPSYGWRPQSTLQPVTFPLQLKLDAGVRLLDTIFQAGTEVAGMVLSQVQTLIGRPAN